MNPTLRIRPLLLALALIGVPPLSAGSWAEPPPTLRHMESATGTVEIFVTAWCTYCRALERYLHAEGIAFKRYDIETDPYGRSLYNRLGGGGVPIARIGGTIVRGFDPVAITEALARRTPARRHRGA